MYLERLSAVEQFDKLVHAACLHPPVPTVDASAVHHYQTGVLHYR